MPKSFDSGALPDFQEKGSNIETCTRKESQNDLTNVKLVLLKEVASGRSELDPQKGLIAF